MEETLLTGLVGKGPEVVLDAILLWLVIRYLPNRDKMFLAEQQKHTAQLNRLVNAFTLILDDDDKRRQRLSDEIFGGKRKVPSELIDDDADD